MFSIVQAQASDGLDIFPSQWTEQLLHFLDLICDLVIAEDLSLDDSGFGSFGKVTNTGRKNGISMIDQTVFGQETNKALM